VFTTTEIFQTASELPYCSDREQERVFYVAKWRSPKSTRYHSSKISAAHPKVHASRLKVKTVRLNVISSARVQYENIFSSKFKPMVYYRLHTSFQLPCLEIFCEEKDVKTNIYFGYI
jgi:hypothetical protein